MRSFRLYSSGKSPKLRLPEFSPPSGPSICMVGLFQERLHEKFVLHPFQSGAVVSDHFGYWVFVIWKLRIANGGDVIFFTADTQSRGTSSSSPKAREINGSPQEVY